MTLSLPTGPVDPTACTTQSQATLARREHAHRHVPCPSQHDDAGYFPGYVTLAMSQPQRRAPARKDKQRPIYTRGIPRYTALRILPTPLRASTWQLRKHRHPPPIGPHGAGHHADGLWYPTSAQPTSRHSTEAARLNPCKIVQQCTCEPSRRLLVTSGGSHKRGQ